MRYLIFVLLVGCSAAKPATCVNTIVEKKGIVGETERSTTCNCTCPVPSQNIVDTGGIVGGLMSLFGKD